jgi:nucleoside-diphosphate-sugar epimerase
MTLDKTHILITGTTGFVGSRLLERALQQGFPVRRALRRAVGDDAVVGDLVVGDLTPDTNWREALRDIEVVVHLAARVHVMHDDATDPLAEFRRINTDATLNLARQAAQSGVKRFIYLSSIKVSGEDTKPGASFLPNDKFVPSDPYGLSKYEAEQGLLALAKETNMEAVIIRPPLVYGPDVKANFQSMMKWVDKGVPLPFGAVYNQRSLVALDNLVSFIIHCIDHPKAANEVFLISDGEDVSTTELLQKVAKALAMSPLSVEF